MGNDRADNKLEYQREHTIEEIGNSKDENARRWEIIREYLPGDEELPLPEEGSYYLDADHWFYKKIIVELLNDFDFIALGISKGVYDESMMYSALGNDFIDLYNMTRRYIAYVKAKGYSLHSLRHFGATQALVSGIDQATVAALLGHASASITLDVYGHVVAGAQERAVASIGEAIAAAEARRQVAQK